MSLPPVDRAQLVATRRDLHQHPELGFEETRTSTLAAERLKSLGYEVKSGVGKTGVVAILPGGPSDRPRCVLLRADMDALPVEEANDVPYRSKHAGKMHACGHDGHVAIGLEVARRLAAQQLGGTVKFAFQPAEEVSHGAQAMIAAGVLDAPKVDAAFGIHLWNDLPVGTVGVMAGPIMASVDEFEIAILGRGGHAAAPHQTVDPVLTAAHVVTALQSLVARRRNPLEEGVVSVTQVNAGHAFNVIPGRADLRGTVRTFGGKFWDDAPSLVEETAQGIAAAFGARAEVRYHRLSAPLVNDERMAGLMAEIAGQVVGPQHVKAGVRTMGGEDMSYFLQQVPGCFAFVGSGPKNGKAAPHHSAGFDIDEESLVIGAEVLSGVAVKYLEDHS
jgi:amidohydrolase